MFTLKVSFGDEVVFNGKAKTALEVLQKFVGTFDRYTVFKAKVRMTFSRGGYEFEYPVLPVQLRRMLGGRTKMAEIIAGKAEKMLNV